MSIAAELKREEEKAKGVDLDNGAENPDIVPFEDNEEEEEEESEEEDESPGQLYGAPGRGRGRGMMWGPHMPLARGGARPFPGMRGFPPNMMGGDGFSYGHAPMNPDGFPMPDLFSMGPRGFGPYGPRFSGDFAGPTAGMMFPGRGSGGFGPMMGPGRGPFMGGMRGGRPVGVPPFYPPPQVAQHSQNSIRAKRDQKAPYGDKNDGFDQSKGQEIAGSGGDQGRNEIRGNAQREDHHYSGGNSYRNDDSESEDEAPRRSRHGEGKKKRRSVEADPTGEVG